MVHRRMKVRLT